MCSNCDNDDFWLPIKGSTFVDKSYFSYIPLRSSQNIFGKSYFRTSVYVKAGQNGKLNIFNAVFLYNPDTKKREFIKILQHQEDVGNEKLVSIYNDLANKKYDNVIPNNLTMQKNVLAFIQNHANKKNIKATAAIFSVEPDLGTPCGILCP
jgi:hypothetical protein